MIGTPPPAEERTLLGTVQSEAPPVAPREQPADPDDLAVAKRAEKIVASLFILAMLAGVGFIAAYIGLPVAPRGRVLQSNLALGISMAVVFLALGVGRGHLGPAADAGRGARRGPQAAGLGRGGPEGVRGDVPGGRGGQRVRQAADPAPDPDRRHCPAGVAPIVLLRDMGPLPGTKLRHTVWRKGLRLVISDTAAHRPADFGTPAG